jgi:hypothetical protein
LRNDEYAVRCNWNKNTYLVNLSSVFDRTVNAHTNTFMSKAFKSFCCAVVLRNIRRVKFRIQTRNLHLILSETKYAIWTETCFVFSTLKQKQKSKINSFLSFFFLTFSQSTKIFTLVKGERVRTSKITSSKVKKKNIESLKFKNDQNVESQIRLSTFWTFLTP